MASSSSLIHNLSLGFVLAIFLLFPHCSFSQNSPESSPAPSPQLPADSSPPAPLTTPSSPSHSPFESPPAPPPSDLDSDSPSPEPSPVDERKPDSPAPSAAGHVNHENQSNAGDAELEDGNSSGGGMSGGQKVGVAFAVVVGACVIGLGAWIYKKRRQNIRRQYGYAARREYL